jgi:hypothetical protein
VFGAPSYSKATGHANPVASNARTTDSAAKATPRRKPRRGRLQIGLHRPDFYNLGDVIPKHVLDPCL